MKNLYKRPMAFNGALTERKEQEQARKITGKTSWNFHFRTKKIR